MTDKPDSTLYEMGKCRPVRRTSDGQMVWVGKAGNKTMKYKRKDVTYWECPVRHRSKEEIEEIILKKKKDALRRKQINEAILSMSDKELEQLLRRCVQKLSQIIAKSKSRQKEQAVLT